MEAPGLPWRRDGNPLPETSDESEAQHDEVLQVQYLRQGHGAGERSGIGNRLLLDADARAFAFA